MKKIIKFIPNIITITRIIMTFIFTYLLIKQFIFYEGEFKELMAAFTVICISDLTDGKIARAMGTSSELGAKLDVFADLLFIVLSYMVMINLKILPLWFFAFICFKFLEFVFTSQIMKFKSRSLNHPFVFDRVGKTVSAVFFVIPGIACIFKWAAIYNSADLINSLLYITFAAGLYSTYTRIKSCFVLDF